jgi:hypothetical protein
MKRTGLAMTDGPDDGDGGRWRWHGNRSDAGLINHLIALTHVAAGSYAKKTVVKSIDPSEIDIVVRYRSDGVKVIDLDVINTTNYDRFFGRIVLDRCLVAQAKMVPAASGSPPWYARISPQRLTGIAVFIAGRERADLGEEWRAHLCEQTGLGLPADQQAMEAVGFVRAAVLCRAEDVEDWLWESVDAVLASRWMSSLFVLLAMVGIAVVFIRQGGLYGLADNIGGVAVVFATALGVIHVGRKVRDVKPPEHKPRRERHQR